MAFHDCCTLVRQLLRDKGAGKSPLRFKVILASICESANSS
jgi:hypothetical protein